MTSIYLGLLATYISSHFFSGVNETTGFILALATFSAGFAVRPLWCAGIWTCRRYCRPETHFSRDHGVIWPVDVAVGLLPDYAKIGVAFANHTGRLRLLQGTSIGGEYGGATYLCRRACAPGQAWTLHELDPDTASLGFINFSSGSSRYARRSMRMPSSGGMADTISGIHRVARLVAVIRLQLNESPVFRRMKAEGKTSKAPLTESFARWRICGGCWWRYLARCRQLCWLRRTFYALFSLRKRLKSTARPRDFFSPSVSH